MKRYAIYYSPSSKTRLGMLGSRWLGRDIDANAAMDQPEVPGIAPDRMVAMTAAARRYGWHLTLKAPFTLSPGRTLDELRLAIGAFAHVRAPVGLPQLQVGVLSGFFALLSESDAHGVSTFAMEVVRAFDRFRAPLEAADIAKRRKAGLSPRQDALLLHWGYPYVMDEYRLHFTLTALADPAERAALTPFLESWFAPALIKSEAITEIALLEEYAPDEPLQLIERFPFGK